MKDAAALKQSILAASAFVLALWWIKLCEWMFGWDLHGLGIYPHATTGLIGIVTATLIHSSWQHLISNTLPLLVLGSTLLYGYPKSRWQALLLIWLLSGVGVWLFARESYHIGASGLTHGMFFFLFVGGLLRRDKRSVGLLMLAFFMYGTMLLTIFPSEPGISFEYHFFGAVAGSLAAVVLHRRDPKPAVKIYSWERRNDEGELIEEEDPIIGDQWMREEDRQALHKQLEEAQNDLHEPQQLPK